MAGETDFRMNSPSPEITVRPRTDEDLEACAALLVEVHAVDGYPVEGVAQPLEWLTPDNILASWVAEDAAGAIVGHVMLMHPGTEDVVRLWRQLEPSNESPIAVGGRLFVRPQERRHGTGGLLAQAALDYALESGTVILLDVMAKDKAAIRMYERLGMHYFGPANHTVASITYPAHCYAWYPV